MKIHVLQHSSINTLGTIEEYAKIKNYPLESTRFYETKTPPKLDSFDLIIMGGPMGIYDYKENPWLRDEKEFNQINSIITENIYTLNLARFQE